MSKIWPSYAMKTLIVFFAHPLHSNWRIIPKLCNILQIIQPSIIVQTWISTRNEYQFSNETFPFHDALVTSAVVKKEFFIFFAQSLKSLNPKCLLSCSFESDIHRLSTKPFLSHIGVLRYQGIIAGLLADCWFSIYFHKCWRRNPPTHSKVKIQQNFL